MTHESSATMIVDEINRLSVAYDKAKEYISKITSSIDQQIGIWQYRRQIILDQLIQMNPSSSYDFLLPKTQRINELTLEAVEALCRVDLLIEQILRIDPKSQIPSTSLPTHSLGANISSSHVRHTTPSLIKPQQQQQSFIPNGKFNEQSTLPMPVIRSSQQSISGRLSTLVNEEKPGFKPVIHQSSPNHIESTTRQSPIYSHNTNIYPANKGLHNTRSTLPSYNTVPVQLHHEASPLVTSSTNQMILNYKDSHVPRGKEKVKLQRIPPGTKWKQAKIDIIDSLSGFYVENLDPKVYERFKRYRDLQKQINEYYSNNPKINASSSWKYGDYCIVKYTKDNQFYRARIIAVPQMTNIANKYDVVYLDYGNWEKVDSINIYPIRRKFTFLPAQAVPCSLAKTLPYNGTVWSDQPRAIELFEELVFEKFVDATFYPKSSRDYWPLSFVDLRLSSTKSNIHEYMKNEGLIREVSNEKIFHEFHHLLRPTDYIIYSIPYEGEENDDNDD
ncbi:unnamed protein product [Rotaria sp. Silwood1]|nr:unnamed protein product [Rotaria sp. Silwood1]